MAIAVITLLFGFWALFQPVKYSKLLSLTPYKEAGVSEIRSTYGGLIIGLSAFVLFNQSSVAFQTLGFAYLGLGLVRGISIFFLDNSYSRKNLFILLFEIGASIVLLLPQIS